MLKRIYMPVTRITPRHLVELAESDQATRDRLNKKTADFIERGEKADRDIDAALNEGYAYITQYDAKSDSEEGVTFVFHKPGNAGGFGVSVPGSDKAL
jgi:hypothetical protein